MVDRVYERNASDSAPQPPADPSTGYPTAGNPAEGVPATQPGAYWYHMITESLRRVVVEAGLEPNHENLDQVVEALQALGLGTGQFQPYSAECVYETGEIARGSDGKFYEFYDRDQAGTVQGVDPTDSQNRPHIWMEWDGVKPGATIEWRSETLPEGYIENDGAEVSRGDYRRVFGAFGTTYGEGDGSTTFLLPDDRGEFKRGWDNGRGVDSGRQLSEHQLDQMQRITGDTGNNQIGNGENINPQSGALSLELGNRNSRGSTAGDNNLIIRFDSANSPDARVSDTTDGETRPRNNAVIYLTKI